jgi:hypothetical protein
MRPSQLTPKDFSSYPPEARALVTREIGTLRQLPLSFLPLLLRETIAYDWKFPVERRELDAQFEYLRSQTPEQLATLMHPFENLTLGPELVAFDWVNDPVQFSEKLSAYLWATHQMDSFREASVDYVHKLNESTSHPTLPVPRLSIVLIGRQANGTGHVLFRKLRAHGVYYSNVNAQGGVAAVLECLSTRAQRYSAVFAHWYIDGGAIPRALPATVATVSYEALEPARVSLADKMIKTMQPGGGGPELLRTELAQMRPSDLNLPETGPEAILSRFKVNLLTQGSGTQIFSTTFVQWTAREVLRRAQPLTLVARFAPRQRDAAFSQLRAELREQDPDGALIDADMAAYYTWLNQERLAGANNARFLVWFEGHEQALIAAPSATPNTVDSSRVDIGNLLNKAMA